MKIIYYLIELWNADCPTWAKNAIRILIAIVIIGIVIPIVAEEQNFILPKTINKICYYASFIGAVLAFIFKFTKQKKNGKYTS